MSNTIPPNVGDILIAANPFALARKIKVTAVILCGEGDIGSERFVADVLEGEDTTRPLTVFRAGWSLYQKEV